MNDDALKRGKDIALGVAAVQTGEKELLKTLQQVADLHPKDAARYEFALDQDIDNTKDSLELASEDLSKRGTEVAAKEAKEKKDREAMMQPKDREEAKAEEKKEAETKRKAPSLLKKGEQPPPQ